jgi:hypothetical protein
VVVEVMTSHANPVGSNQLDKKIKINKYFDMQKVYSLNSLKGALVGEVPEKAIRESE